MMIRIRKASPKNISLCYILILSFRPKGEILLHGRIFSLVSFVEWDIVLDFGYIVPDFGYNVRSMAW